MCVFQEEPPAGTDLRSYPSHHQLSCQESKLSRQPNCRRAPPVHEPQAATPSGGSSFQPHLQII